MNKYKLAVFWDISPKQLAKKCNSKKGSCPLHLIHKGGDPKIKVECLLGAKCAYGTEVLPEDWEKVMEE